MNVQIKFSAVINIEDDARIEFFCWLLNYAVVVSFCVDSTSIS